LEALHNALSTSIALLKTKSPAEVYFNGFSSWNS
jgi:hypothetical protein